HEQSYFDAAMNTVHLDSKPEPLTVKTNANLIGSNSSTATSSSSSSSACSSAFSSEDSPAQQQQMQQSPSMPAAVGEASRMVSARCAAINSSSASSGVESRTQRGFSCAFDEVLASNRAVVQAENVPGRRINNNGACGGTAGSGCSNSGNGRSLSRNGSACGANGSYSFILPDLSTYPLEFRAFLEKELLDTGTLVNLEQAGCLNWWHDLGLSQRLWPLQTSGDGNCLLHAISLSSLGFHDRQLVFRSALHEYLLSHSAAVYRRWRWQTARELYRATGLRLSESEWQSEWKSLLQLASAQPKQQQQQQIGQQHQHQLDSLEEIHVFVAANVFRRPIIVIADQFVKDSEGDNLAPIPFAGIYLPLLEKPEHCSKHPVLLAYDAAHFSALVPMETAVNLPYAVPLCCCDLHTPLPLHFSADPGPHWKWSSKSAAAAVVNDAPVATPDTEMGGRLRAKLLASYLRCSTLRLPVAPPQPLPAAVAQAAVAAVTQRPVVVGLTRSGSSVGNAAQLSMATVGAVSADDSGFVEYQQQQQQQQLHSQLQQRSATLDCRRMRGGVDGLYPGGMSQGQQNPSRSLGHQLLKAMQQRLPIRRTGKSSKWPSVATPTSPADASSVADQALLDSASTGLLCAHLGVTNRPPHFTDAVSSYLTSAMARFSQLDELQKRRSAEIIDQQMRRSALMQCVGPNCDMFAREETNFLCSRCYQDQQLLMKQMLNDDH
ncbi:hypothetical protein BOX15_Mlig019012g1, partial [Macrostomum lignano]